MSKPEGEVMETNAEAQPLWLSYKQSQSLTGLSRGTLWGLVGSGKVEAAKIGSRVLISRESLLRYLASQSYAEVVRK
jgi:excisionase family DNA binding protein